MKKSLNITNSIHEVLNEATKNDDIRIEEKGTRRITADLANNIKISAPYLRWTGYEGEDHCIAILSGAETDYEPVVMWCCGITNNLSNWNVTGFPGTGYDWVVKHKGIEDLDQAKAIYKKLAAAVNKQGTLAAVSKAGDWEEIEGKHVSFKKPDLKLMKDYLDKKD